MAQLYILLALLYLLALFAMKRSWDKHERKHFNGTPNASAALLIAFRNEKANLPRLLKNLEKSIPPEGEVIFVDDNSRDGSPEIIHDFLQENRELKWRLLYSPGKGKKRALSAAIGHTRAEIIITTDADCMVSNRWLWALLRPFHEEHVQLVSGPVMTSPGNTFFEQFQQIEWASILLLTQFLFARGQPSMCSAANLAYRKSAFLEVGGYAGNEQHLSGDDEFLLKKIIQRFGADSAIYLNKREVLVKTAPLPHWNLFVQQRIRWASKWKLHGFSPNLLGAALTVALAAIQVGSVSLVFGGNFYRLAFVVFWLTKILGEKWALGNLLKQYKIQPSLLSFIKSSLLHPLYILWVAPLAAMGNFTWKGRTQKAVAARGQ